MKLVQTARNPIPYGAELHVVAGQGPKLRAAVWPAITMPALGTVCIFPGRAEFIEKYFETVADLRRRGFAVAILDWRGQGGSERLTADPRKGHIGSFAEYIDDAGRFMASVVTAKCPPPYTALAHSMGGNILLDLSARPTVPFSRLILTAPMIALAPGRLGTTPAIAALYARSARLTGFGAQFVPGGGPAGLEAMAFEGNPLTRDRERFRRNQEVAVVAPELMIGDPTVAWLAAALGEMHRLQRPSHPPTVRIPVLAFAASADRIVSGSAIEDYCDRLRIGRCFLLTDCEHEILQETDAVRGRFWSAFDAFMDVQSAVA